MNENLSLRCAACGVCISQRDADESAEIFPESGLTLCQDCARALGWMPQRLKLCFVVNNGYDSILLADTESGVVYTSWTVTAEMARIYLARGHSLREWDVDGGDEGDISDRSLTVEDFGELVGENGELEEDARKRWLDRNEVAPAEHSVLYLD